MSCSSTAYDCCDVTSRTGVGDVMDRTTARRSRDRQVGVATAERGAASGEEVGVVSSSRDQSLLTALGVAVGVVVVAMVMIIAICAWRHRQQRRLLGIVVTENERVPIQLAQCRFPRLAVSSANIT